MPPSAAPLAQSKAGKAVKSTYPRLVTGAAVTALLVLLQFDALFANLRKITFRFYFLCTQLVILCQCYTQLVQNGCCITLKHVTQKILNFCSR